MSKNKTICIKRICIWNIPKRGIHSADISEYLLVLRVAGEDFFLYFSVLLKFSLTTWMYYVCLKFDFSLMLVTILYGQAPLNEGDTFWEMG